MNYVGIYRNPDGHLRSQPSLNTALLNLDSFEEAGKVARLWLANTGRAHCTLVCIVLADIYIVLRSKFAITTSTSDADRTRFISDNVLTLGRDAVWFPTVSEYIATPKVTTPAKPRKPEDLAPNWWDLVGADGTPKVKPDAAMDAVRAMCKGS